MNENGERHSTRRYVRSKGCTQRYSAHAFGNENRVCAIARAHCERHRRQRNGQHYASSMTPAAVELRRSSPDSLLETIFALPAAQRDLTACEARLSAVDVGTRAWYSAVR